MKQHEGLKSNIQIQFLKRYVQVYSTISKELQRLYDSQPDNLTAQVLHSRSYNSRDQKTGPHTNFTMVQSAYILNKAMVE